MTNFLDLGPKHLLTTLGTATGDLGGAVAATVLDMSSLDSDTIILTMQHHWVTEAGDFIFMDPARATAKWVIPFELAAIVKYEVPIIGGTGKFAEATGTTTNIGEVDMIGGRTVFRYQGTVCFPAPGR